MWDLKPCLLAPDTPDLQLDIYNLEEASPQPVMACRGLHAFLVAEERPPLAKRGFSKKKFFKNWLRPTVGPK